jgi:glycosyltransferase involved in cell wall biosynthesis
MPRLLFASHPPDLTTSYARVVRQFAAAAAADGHAVAFVNPAVRAAGPDVATLTPAIGRALGAAPADLLVTVGDPWMFDGLDAPAARPACRWLACFPLDGGPVPRAWARWMAAADERVVFSRFAAGLVDAAVGRRPWVLYHGVDLAVFAPMDKAAAKRRVVGDDRAFVVGCVAANQPRKNLPALVRAFAAFAADKPDALLYLHAPVVGYWDLEELADRHGVAARVRATLRYDPLRGLPDETLAVVYNAFDVLALPTMGEGFGLPLLEAQACGVPVVATDCSACSELLPDPAQRARVAATLVMGRNIEQAVVDEADLAGKLAEIYRDERLRTRLGAAGMALACGMGWAEVRASFSTVVRAVIGGDGAVP